MIINQTPYVLSEWNEEYRYYINTWYGFIYEDVFIEAVNIGLEYMVSNNVKFHLADATHMEGGWDSGEWLMKYFWPKVHAAGLTHFGLIIGEDVFNEAASLIMENLLHENKIYVQYRNFQTKAAAEAWVKAEWEKIENEA